MIVIINYVFITVKLVVDPISHFFGEQIGIKFFHVFGIQQNSTSEMIYIIFMRTCLKTHEEVVNAEFMQIY